MKKALRIAVLCLALAAVFTGGFFIGRGVKKSSAVKVAYGDMLPSGKLNDTVHIIGHKNPDTDSVCSAIVCARLLNSTLDIRCIPHVAGKINNETKFVLEYFDAAVPETLEDASGLYTVLVDFSSTLQAVSGMNDATVLGIFDHHGLGSMESSSPIVVKCMPVGSTATVLYSALLENGIDIDRSTAGLILSSVLSDTNNLTSATTTKFDRQTVANLSKTAGITDVDGYYALMSRAAESYEGMTDEEIFLSDYKDYDMSGTSVGISCVNAENREAVAALTAKAEDVMDRICAKQGAEHLYVLIKNDEINETTVVFYGEGAKEILEEAFGRADITFSPAASRKKDFVPPLTKAYESLSLKNAA